MTVRTAFKRPSNRSRIVVVTTALGAPLTELNSESAYRDTKVVRAWGPMGSQLVGHARQLWLKAVSE